MKPEALKKASESSGLPLLTPGPFAPASAMGRHLADFGSKIPAVPVGSRGRGWCQPFTDGTGGTNLSAAAATAAPKGSAKAKAQGRRKPISQMSAAEKKQLACIFHRKGTCQAGDACEFGHNGPQDLKPTTAMPATTAPGNTAAAAAAAALGSLPGSRYIALALF